MDPTDKHSSSDDDGSRFHYAGPADKPSIDTGAGHRDDLARAELDFGVGYRGTDTGAKVPSVPEREQIEPVVASDDAGGWSRPGYSEPDSETTDPLDLPCPSPRIPTARTLTARTATEAELRRGRTHVAAVDASPSRGVFPDSGQVHR